ncbi:hypothetical protein M0R45_026369 [Rubus argutus]|uniref:Transmembrane protein n=1 Tax=Rubus argutus TaxID=59490 RepID=A0AAW1X0X8_RUBAR
MRKFFCAPRSLCSSQACRTRAVSFLVLFSLFSLPLLLVRLPIPFPLSISFAGCFFLSHGTIFLLFFLILFSFHLSRSSPYFISFFLFQHRRAARIGMTPELAGLGGCARTEEARLQVVGYPKASWSSLAVRRHQGRQLTWSTAVGSSTARLVNDDRLLFTRGIVEGSISS